VVESSAGLFAEYSAGTLLLGGGSQSLLLPGHVTRLTSYTNSSKVKIKWQ